MLTTSAQLDMTKAYERIGRQNLWGEGSLRGADLALMRVSLDIYAGARRCKLGQTHSGAFSIERSILAGCGFTTSWLKVLTLEASSNSAGGTSASCCAPSSRTSRSRAQGRSGGCSSYRRAGWPKLSS